MIVKNYLGTFDNLLQKNRLLGFALLVMLAWNAWNWTSLQRAQHAVRVAITPPGSIEPIEIGNGKANENYLRKMARYITAQVGTYNAGTVRPQLMELVTLFHPSKVGAAQAEFQKLATQIERYPSISSIARWAGSEGTLKYTDDLIQVHTIKSRLVNGAETESQTVWYCIRYVIEDTRFWLKSIEERTGNGNDLCMFEKAPATAEPANGAASK